MTSNSSSSDVPQSLYAQRIAPEYDVSCSEVSIQFETELAFDLWFENTARRHAHWITRQTNISKRNAAITAEMSEEASNVCLLPKMVRYLICDHGRSKSVKEKTTAEGSEVASKKRRIRKKPSIKVNCPARITKTTLYNGEVNVKYVWQHANHDPLDKSDIASSRLPKTIKDLVRQQADSNKV
ncbi:hypothetical protein BDF21DRAFT_425379 [Thamnidium elegans]|uniref:Uncharacterized protein n=1 Tax=Thamnidium elegans TaxID=101142 RepID=A0A8H7SQ07_9FUNG|nr:hypothetical protein INT48_000896 [Thamnidium elegans]KAI8070278.1 hypothetical protein BDF21DRAFT_425379 [Thamnidium elegans]